MMSNWLADHKEEKRAYDRAYHALHKEDYVRYQREHKEQQKQYHAKWLASGGKDWKKEYDVKYRVANKTLRNKHDAEYRKANKEKISEAHKKWQAKNPEKWLEIQRECSRRKRDVPKNRLSLNVCRGINKSIKVGSKAGRKWEGLVGYTIDGLKRHLEAQFKEGMLWQNYGEWHIDHKIPISVFNFLTPEDIDFKKCWALSNLQPLWAIENIIKSNKIGSPL